MAGHLIRNLESVNQVVPESLLQLAMKSAWFRNSRERGANRPQQRLGLGYKPKSKSWQFFYLLKLADKKKVCKNRKLTMKARCLGTQL